MEGSRECALGGGDRVSMKEFNCEAMAVLFVIGCGYDLDFALRNVYVSVGFLSGNELSYELMSLRDFMARGRLHSNELLRGYMVFVSPAKNK